MRKRFLTAAVSALLVLSSLQAGGAEAPRLKAENPKNITFQEVSVHDPAIVRDDDGTYYVFGSHLAVAKSQDLMNWDMVADGVKYTSPIIPKVLKELKEAFKWSHSADLWAPEVQKLGDGKYHMYYCTCIGDAPVSALGIAAADKIDGPYKNQQIILRSGQGDDEKDENGNRYDATKDPNCIDPNLFYDKEGNLWMVYGSYSGGIFVKELDKDTGLPLESGYGKKLLGANHLRIEGPYIQYNPDTDYYYLFLSFGGLNAEDGYNIRVARSENPDGPYVDSMGQPMKLCAGAPGTFFDDKKAEKFGAKLMGAYKFEWEEGEEGEDRKGYKSMGHNSCYYDPESGKYFIIYHQRFEKRGEDFEVRVHQMWYNDEGWPVIAPYRYTGESVGDVTAEEAAGTYKYINMGREITSEMARSVNIELSEDGKISSKANDISGTWELKNGHDMVLTVDGKEYHGVICRMYDDQGNKEVLAFSALNAETGVTVWGSGQNALD